MSTPRLSADPTRLLAATLVVVALVTGVVAWLEGWRVGADSAVYRAGALTFLHGDPLYGLGRLSALPSWVALPFTYPPAAALLFTPLTALPAGLAWGVVSVASVLSVAMVVRICARPAGRLTVVGLTVVGLGLEPVWRTLALGQINLILMAIVVIDVLVLAGSRWSGMLVGVAAAVKLTPLIFVGYLFLTGRWRDGLRALATFGALQGLMFLLIPHDAIRYWTEAVLDPSRVGGVNWAFNQSLNGLLNRAAHAASWSGTLALLIAAVLAVPAAWLVRRLHRRGEDLAALLVTAFLGVLASPISWSHHWVWAVPLIALLLVKRHLVWAGAITLFLGSSVIMLVPNGGDTEFGWGLGWSILGNSYVLAAVLGILGLTVRELRRPVS
ncbi:MAG TPA: glycosyltransferase 87 family protein [Amycolatopsis sp.]|nr:glycosyltransferase 87 family protein [Amycolatopsis sp.]